MQQRRPRKVGERPLKRFLEGLHPDYKKLLARKLRDIITHCSPELSYEDGPPPLEECFKILGMCEMRLTLIREVEGIVRGYENSFWRSITEVTDLRENIKKQRELAQKLVQGHLYELSKEKDNGLCDSDKQ